MQISRNSINNDNNNQGYTGYTIPFLYLHLTGHPEVISTGMEDEQASGRKWRMHVRLETLSVKRLVLHGFYP
jgi:hypothetical protein